MLQELLIALLGYGGPIFQQKENHKYKVCSGVFSTREETILLRVLETAEQYSRLLTFCRNNSSGNGRYRAALAAAITNAVLPYRQSVVSLEREVLANPRLSVTHIRTALHPHVPALLTLTRLLDEVDGNALRGCRLLEAVHNHTEQAVLDNRDLMNKLEQSVHGVLYDQLSQWLLCGALCDPHKEFFLQQQELKDALSRVSLVPELLPAHLPATLAHKILFVGEAVREFEGQQADEEGRFMAGGRLLGGGETFFLEAVTALAEARVFSLHRLTDTVETIRAAVSKHLCEVARSGGVLTGLEELKAVMLLGRGELYHTLLRVGAPLLDGPPIISTNVTALLQSCGQLVHVEEALLDRFSASCSQEALDSLPLVVADTQGHVGTGWSSLRVQYSSSGAVQQLLGAPSVQRRYSSLFAFLLCVRRAQHRLHTCCINHLDSARRGPQQQEGRAAWTLRHHMTLLIDGLQYYLQVDVLEAHHYRLVTSIERCCDYQQLQTLISAYLSNLAVHCFLAHKLVSKCFSLVFSLCHKLCDILQATELSHAATTASPGSLSEISSEFDSACSKLFVVLCSVQQLPGQQHTASLLARLDFNDYYRDKQRRALKTDQPDEG